MVRVHVTNQNRVGRNLKWFDGHFQRRLSWRWDSNALYSGKNLPCGWERPGPRLSVFKEICKALDGLCKGWVSFQLPLEDIQFGDYFSRWLCLIFRKNMELGGLKFEPVSKSGPRKYFHISENPVLAAAEFIKRTEFLESLGLLRPKLLWQLKVLKCV